MQLNQNIDVLPYICVKHRKKLRAPCEKRRFQQEVPPPPWIQKGKRGSPPAPSRTFEAVPFLDLFRFQKTRFKKNRGEGALGVPGLENGPKAGCLANPWFGHHPLLSGEKKHGIDRKWAQKRNVHCIKTWGFWPEHYSLKTNFKPGFRKSRLLSILICVGAIKSPFFELMHTFS